MAKGMFDEVLENVGEPYKGGKGFEYGTHEVIIGSVESKEKKTKNDDAAAVIEVIVFDEKDNDKTATCTLYFHTEGGAKMAVTKILGIMVHNVGEEKKEKVRELGKKLFSKIEDPKEARDVAFKLMTDKMIGKKAYLFAEPNGDYKTTSYGDVWHYAYEDPDHDDKVEAAEREAEKAAETVGGKTEEAGDDIPDFDDL